jgi:hypothetical protein
MRVWANFRQRALDTAGDHQENGGYCPVAIVRTSGDVDGTSKRPEPNRYLPGSETSPRSPLLSNHVPGGQITDHTVERASIESSCVRTPPALAGGFRIPRQAVSGLRIALND